MNQPSTGDEQGRLLEKFREESALTWAEMAARIGISETYLHRVRSGKQRFSRKVMNRLNELVNKPKQDQVREERDGDYLTRTTQEHIVWLEDQLTACRQNETRLLQIVETLSTLIAGPRTGDQGRADAAAPAGVPAVPASGVLYKTRRSKSA